jgi:hypothetical protein
VSVDLEKLAKPFPPEKVKQKRGQGNRVMSYISHGLVTERLNEVDPDWSSDVLTEHIYRDAQTGRLHCEGVTLRLTINGVSRVESGGPQRQDGFANEIKNAYSDALKRAAMRFGVALSMWESLVDAEYDEDAHPDYEAGQVQPSRSPATLTDRTRAQRSSWPRPIPGAPMTERQLRRLMGPIRTGQNMSDADVRAQVFLRYGHEHIHDMSVPECSELMDLLEKGDHLTGSVPPLPRHDPREANQQGMEGMPEEPAHLREWLM